MDKYAKLEDVIERLDYAIYLVRKGELDSYLEAMQKLRVEYAEIIPTIEASEDCVSRIDVLKIIDKHSELFKFISDADEVMTDIDSLPSVAPRKE